jgi:hypothetical protein
MSEVIEETRHVPGNLFWTLFGPPPVDADDSEKIGPVAGIPVLGLDALNSAAYRPDRSHFLF